MFRVNKILTPEWKLFCLVNAVTLYEVKAALSTSYGVLSSLRFGGSQSKSTLMARLVAAGFQMPWPLRPRCNKCGTPFIAVSAFQTLCPECRGSRAGSSPTPDDLKEMGEGAQEALRALSLPYTRDFIDWYLNSQSEYELMNLVMYLVKEL